MPIPADPAFRTWQETWRERLARQPASAADAIALMQRSNPVVIPRNHRVEEALDAAEGGDMSPYERLLAAIREPWGETPANEPYRVGPPAGCGPYRTFCGT